MSRPLTCKNCTCVYRLVNEIIRGVVMLSCYCICFVMIGQVTSVFKHKVNKRMGECICLAPCVLPRLEQGGGGYIEHAAATRYTARVACALDGTNTCRSRQARPVGITCSHASVSHHITSLAHTNSRRPGSMFRTTRSFLSTDLAH